jgi:acyl carrier protein
MQMAADASTTEQRILAQVSRMLVEIIGEEYVLDLDIDMDTSFTEDLELESIEFVTLSTRLAEYYGDAVDFVGFLAGKEVDEIIEMTVGELVSYVAQSLSRSRAVASAVAESVAGPAGG